jgi:AcrR family transcriptional regulator
VIPSDRFTAVVDAAAQVFITHGYQRAQMQDVADALGLAKGTLYGYARSKAALFAAAIRYADGREPLPDPADLPVPPPADGETAQLVTGRLAAVVADLELTRLPADPGAGHQTDLGAVVTDLYGRLAEHRTGIKLVDRCAPELPELATVWFGAGRHALVVTLADHLTRSERAGTLALPGPAPLVSRTIIELCTLWAVHCHFDAAPAAAQASPVDDAAVAAMLATLITRGTAPHPTAPPSTPAQPDLEESRR